MTFLQIEAYKHGRLVRAGEMIPEVEGTRPLGPSRKRVPKCLKGPKTTYTTIAIAEKQSKRSKKGPFSLGICILGPPGSYPGNGIYGARRGSSLAVPPPPVSPAMRLHLFPAKYRQSARISVITPPDVQKITGKTHHVVDIVLSLCCEAMECIFI